MKKNILSNVQLGLFVLIGIGLLIGTLYMIGNNRNMFDRSFKINVIFRDLNGLMPGNNVRFAGINIGTVKEAQILTDSTVSVTLVLQNEMKKFIRKNSTASIGTDGLMGNKIVNIGRSDSPAEPIVEGDVLTATVPPGTDQMLRTLDRTNSNLFTITSDLKNITYKLNNSKSLWNLLADSTITEDLQTSVLSLRTTTKNTAILTENLNGLFSVDKKDKKSVAGLLLGDTATASGLAKSLENLEQTTNRTARLSADLNKVAEKLRENSGTAGMLLNDTAVARDLRKSASNIRISAEKFRENMDALKSNFLFRGYYRKQERKEKRASVNDNKPTK